MEKEEIPFFFKLRFNLYLIIILKPRIWRKKHLKNTLHVKSGLILIRHY